MVLVLPPGPLIPRRGLQHSPRLPCGGAQGGMGGPMEPPPSAPASPPALEGCQLTGEDVSLELRAGDSLRGRFPMAFSLC